MDILLWILFGLVVGVVAKFLMPGPNPGGLIMATILGIVGAVVGAWIGRALGFYGAGQPAGFVMAVIGAILVLVVYHFVRSRAR
jgi:uncharacterized membrane protein YeaQ/YmgE (transglycosylase-associated protein family)